MKRVLTTLALMALTATVAKAAITGSAHDFTDATWGNGEICAPCHTPHSASDTVTDAPLWNHTVTTTASFTVYTSSTMTTKNITAGQPAGVSKLCLSCHDGAVALDSFGGATGSTTISGAALVGTDLSNDHPISVEYNTTKDPGLQTTMGADVELFGGNVECASCHDVHNAADTTSLLRVSNAGSVLCLQCHNK